MKICFVSNYINHHQIPFCEEMTALTGGEFTFFQTMPMEAERTRMGWAVDTKALPFVREVTGNEVSCKEAILQSDVAIFGWSERFDLERERLDAGKLSIRISERIYRNGRWRRFSPKGLYHKYQEHLRYRNAPVYLLCAGAYVASDFALINAYPGKKFCWGYFPPLRTYTTDELREMKHRDPDEPVRILYAGRLMELKHPEAVLCVAKALSDGDVPFHAEVIGDGELRAALEEQAKQLGLENTVSFSGMLSPEEVRRRMERAHIFLFPSDYREGWGAVVNEAMNAGCAVVACAEAGSVPFLVRHEENGLIYAHSEDFTNCARQVQYLVTHEDTRMQMGLSAYETVHESWNAKHAAKALYRFCEDQLGSGTFSPPQTGPMSIAPLLQPVR